MPTKSLNSASTGTIDAGLAPLVGRIMIALIFVVSGVGKLAAPVATIGYIASAGLPLPQLAYGLALLVELGGGLALGFGYRTRIAAAVLAVFSVAAALSFHHNFADQNQMIHFLKNIAMAGGLMFASQAGAGRYSLDARR